MEPFLHYVLAEMAVTGKSLSELCADLSKYPQDLINVKLGDAVAADIMAMISCPRQSGMLNLNLLTQDVLLRPSGTEPLIRVMVEGQDSVQVNRIADRLLCSQRFGLNPPGPPWQGGESNDSSLRQRVESECSSFRQWQLA